MQDVLKDIQDGVFADRFMKDQASGGKEFAELRAKEEKHPIETTGRKLRSLFAWEQTDEDYTEGTAAR